MMCDKNSPPPTAKTNSIMKKKNKKTQKRTKESSSSTSSSSTSSSLKPHRRRNRTKTRKPKFLSLRLQLSQNENKPKKMTHQQHQQPKTEQQQQPQLNLFPLHPENMVEDKDMHEENNVALLFSSDGGATLNGLLEDESTTTTTATTTSEEGSFSPLTCPSLNGGDNGSWLVRKAMRRRSIERDNEGSEERWVCYSEVVEKKELMEEVTSYCGGATMVTATEDPLFCVGGGKGMTTSFGLLSLKLDHEEILNAWSDKGSLYVAEEEAPQTVPDLLNGVLLPNVAWDSWGSDVVGNTWKVPEDCGANKMEMKEQMGWKLGQREASVLRYKEKRQNRLFSKRIRYEVRKLNAEKRPRMKGRFVKRE
ncbi:uncharacterized protein LOC133288171 [Gastrolobium bilobum]|uniref:uncharacterized protein LOC133288171 n=1 Tax=Gastrolobium bilobum TaxID=150636 RepID=UPI002AAFFD89|nr:uncharacterized protein LOC133288171 [Gastrolobium bilobum]